MIIGITGCISSGKSFVLNLLKNFGYEVYQTDNFTIDAYENDIIKTKLNEKFNCLKNNKIDKLILKKKINENIDNLKTINNIIHPFIYEKVKSLNKKEKLIFVEIPLLFEANFDKICDVTITISIDDNLRLNLLRKRNKENFAFYQTLEKQQFSQNKKIKLADYVIKNDLNKENMIYQIKSIIDSCNKLL